MCTFLILITRPFKIGDTIEFSGENVKGRVVDLGMFFTTLKTEDDAFFQFPNNMIFQKTIKRYPSKPVLTLWEQLNSKKPID
jgi:small-conductance mechanosensitive channel